MHLFGAFALRPRPTWASIWTVALSSIAVAHAGPMTYLVDSTVDSLLLDACIDSLDGDCSLRGALELANSDGSDSRIVLADGIYRLTRVGVDENANQTGDLDVAADGDLEIVAVAGSHPIIEQTTDDRILDADPAGGFSVVVTGPMSFRGGSITAGQAPYGGLLQLGVGTGLQSIQLVDLFLEDGHADGLGGCLLLNGTEVQLDRVVVAHCSAHSGGGAFVAADLFTASHSHFLDSLVGPTAFNDAPQSGGGLQLQLSAGGSAAIRDSIFRGNQVVEGAGGGLRSTDGNLEIERSEFSANRVGGNTALIAAGGGLSVGNTTLGLENVTVSGNSTAATNQVGIGLHATSSPTQLRFVTVSEPSATDQFGNAAVFFSSSEGDLDHSIVVGGCDASADSPPVTSQGGNVFETTASTPVCGLLPGDDQMVAAAGLLQLAPYGSESRTHALTIGSPARDQGNFFDTGCPATDQRRAGRALFSLCDSGAHESSTDAPPPVIFLFRDGFESGNTSSWSSTAS